MRAACEAAGATEVFATDDADEGEMFVAARRMAFPALEPRGSLLLDDVGVPVPLLPDLLDAIAAHRGDARRRDPGGRARRRRQHPPHRRLRRRRPATRERARGRRSTR